MTQQKYYLVVHIKKTLDVLLQILNSMCDHLKYPPILKYLKLGDCVKGIMEYKDTYGLLQNETDYNSLQHKQIMISAILNVTPQELDQAYDMTEQVDDKGNLKNMKIAGGIDKRLAYKIMGTTQFDKTEPRNNGQIMGQCIVNKYKFWKYKSRLLYNPLTCENRKRDSKFDADVIQLADDHWKNKTSPNPNSHVFRKLKNPDTGQREVHAHHYIDGFFNEEHLKWQQINSEFLKDKKIPSESWFQQRRQKFHKYIYHTPVNDFSKCQRHFNWHQICRALESLFANQYIHQCEKPTIPRKYTSKAKHYGIKCGCNRCEECMKLAKLLNKKSMDLIQLICCDNNGRFPKIECTRSKCEEKLCGIKYIVDKYENRKCNHNFSECIVSYDQIEYVEPKVSGVKPHNEPFDKTWETFIDYATEYIKHHTTFVWSFASTKEFIENIDDDKILSNDWDFINNPKVEYYKKSQSQWGKQSKYSYLVDIERWFDGDIKHEESTNIFLKEKAHGYCTALYAINRHYDDRIDFWKDTYGKKLKIMYNQSDRGEFLTTAFMDGLSVTSADKGVNSFWSTPAPEHGKRKVDSEGHVIKTAQRTGVMSKSLVYTEDMEHVETAKNFCEEYFNSKIKQRADRKIDKRNFVSITDSIEQIKSGDVAKTFDGITQYYQFGFFGEPHVVWYHELPCYCEFCKNGDLKKCINIDICGPWRSIKITPKRKMKSWDQIMKEVGDFSIPANMMTFEQIKTRSIDMFIENNHENKHLILKGSAATNLLARLWNVKSDYNINIQKERFTSNQDKYYLPSGTKRKRIDHSNVIMPSVRMPSIITP
eukprot:347797_1